MKQILYYANGGSGNHGCEAIIRSLEHIISPQIKSINMTIAPTEDNKYGLLKLVNLIDVKSVSRANLHFFKSYLRLKLTKSVHALDVFPYAHILSNIKAPDTILALSVGGDNYCYGGTDFYDDLDTVFHKKGFKTILVGCSIEPEVISNPKVKTDLLSHELIIARESITYTAMCDEGLRNVVLLPDPAFALETTRIDLPTGFIEGNTVGINLSPMVNRFTVNDGIVQRNADKLLSHIIETTNMQIALIPHVVWPQSNDLDTLRPLYEKYKGTGRVILIDDCNAEVLKGYISRCRMMIAARTHASIAAYSTHVPTLVIGYSVKSKGIAKDILGTDDNYVIAAQDFKTDTDLIDRFEWLMENENTIRTHLQSFMPDYCQKAYGIRNELERIG